jgi:hypothetical protein
MTGKTTTEARDVWRFNVCACFLWTREADPAEQRPCKLAARVWSVGPDAPMPEEQGARSTLGAEDKSSPSARISSPRELFTASSSWNSNGEGFPFHGSLLAYVHQPRGPPVKFFLPFFCPFLFFFVYHEARSYPGKERIWGRTSQKDPKTRHKRHQKRHQNNSPSHLVEGGPCSLNHLLFSAQNWGYFLLFCIW